MATTIPDSATKSISQDVCIDLTNDDDSCTEKNKETNVEPFPTPDMFVSEKVKSFCRPIAVPSIGADNLHTSIWSYPKENKGKVQLKPVVTPYNSFSSSEHENPSSRNENVQSNDIHNVPIASLKTPGDGGAAVRRSKRSTVSTLIYINGNAVKKENNYVVTGHSYKYAPVATEVPKKGKQQVNTPHKGMIPAERKQRVPTKLEVERMRMKEKILTNIQEMKPNRCMFFSKHLPVLQPFLDPKVVSTIETWKLQQQPSIGVSSSSAGNAASDNTMYLQPDLITADMRDYQLDGLNWMAKMCRNNVGMILGDEMGLGKTLQTISLICHLKEKKGTTGPNLIICPLSVLYSWCSEIAKWAPSLKYLRFHSSNPEAMVIQNFGDYDMIVTTYEMAKNPALKHLWSCQYFNLLVLDEGHKIKCAECQISQAVRRLHCENRLILTGTPLANNLVELWALLNFLVHDIFTTVQPFADAFDISNNIVDNVKLGQAHNVLNLFMLRRLKTEVEKLMPKKIETKVICPLSNIQIWWYKALLLKDINLLAKGTVSQAKVLSNLIMQLRKVCVHPFLFPEAEDIESTSLEHLVGASGKLAVLDKLLCTLYNKNHRVVLFSQFTRVLDIIDDYATMRGWNYCRFDGSTSRAKRNYIVKSFNAPDSPKFLFLMSTRSGGMGLNLQTADTCILFDSDWNPQPDIQAMARVHRIGQTKTVHVYRLVTEGTVEQRMVERAEKKLYLDRMVTRDGAERDELEDETEDAGKLMACLKFGCNAVFGENSGKNQLPTAEDIEIITDRLRTEDYSCGSLKGGVESKMDEFDATIELTKLTNFAGIDFKKIRDEYERERKAKSMNEIMDEWKKRQRKNRIIMVSSNGSGYGSAMVPVLQANDYDLESGERSVFQKELKGRHEMTHAVKKRKIATFDSQDFCQICGDGGEVVICSRCPITVHLYCVGLKHAKHAFTCPHHQCVTCGIKTVAAGGFIFPCQSCPNAYCEDHLPENSRLLDPCERMTLLNFKKKDGCYIHCSPGCESVAIQEFGWKVPGRVPKPPCPTDIDLSKYFGCSIDENINAPDGIVYSKTTVSAEVVVTPTRDVPQQQDTHMHDIIINRGSGTQYKKE